VTSSDKGLSFPEERAWKRGWFDFPPSCRKKAQKPDVVNAKSLKLALLGERQRHRVDTYRDGTGRRKHCGDLRFHILHFFSGDRAKNDQLRVLGKFREQLKRAVIQ
jgi:hypothetical protein